MSSKRRNKPHSLSMTLKKCFIVFVITFISSDSCSPSPSVRPPPQPPAPPPTPTASSTTASPPGIIFSSQGDRGLYGSNVTRRSGKFPPSVCATSTFINTQALLPSGSLITFYAYVTDTTDNFDTYMQIFRPTSSSANRVSLVWKQCLPQMSRPGLATISMSDAFCVQAGDLIGWTGKCQTISSSSASSPQMQTYRQVNTGSYSSDIDVGSSCTLNPGYIAYEFSIAVEVSNTTTSSPPPDDPPPPPTGPPATQSPPLTPIVVPYRPNPQPNNSDDADDDPKPSKTAPPKVTTATTLSTSKARGDGTPSSTPDPPQTSTLDKNTIIIVAAVVVGGVVIIIATILAVVIVVLKKRTAATAAANTNEAASFARRQLPFSRAKLSTRSNVYNSTNTIVDDVDTYDTVHDDGYTSLESSDHYSVVHRATVTTTNYAEPHATARDVTLPGITDVNGYLILLADGEDQPAGSRDIAKFSRALSHPLPAVPRPAGTATPVIYDEAFANQKGATSRKSLPKLGRPSEVTATKRSTSSNGQGKDDLANCENKKKSIVFNVSESFVGSSEVQTDKNYSGQRGLISTSPSTNESGTVRNTVNDYLDLIY